jgi:branched-chain amino acid transport system substrate-binding protein
MLAFALVATACGTTLSREERLARRAAEDGRSRAATGAADASGVVAGNSSAAAATPAADASQGAVAAPVSGSSGTGSGATPGGTRSGSAGASTGSTAGGAAACAAPSHEVGVSDTAITLGGVNQLSGPVPGLAETAVKGAQAYINMVNANGGVCGRQVKLIVADDRSEAGQNAAQHEQLKSRVLGFAGEFSALDGGGATVLKGTNIPTVSVDTDPAWSGVTGHYSPTSFANAVTPQRYRYMASRGAKTAALVVVAVSAARSNADFEQKNFEAAGIRVVLRQEVSVTEFSFAAAARAVANSKADVMLFLHTADASAAMARELQKVPYLPKFPYYIVAYGSSFLETAGTAAEGAATPLTFAPFEDRASNPSVNDLLTWFERTGPGLKPDRFAVDAWAGTRLLLEAVASVPGAITREAVLARLAATHRWDAGGLETPSDVGARKPTGCYVVVRVRSGRWVREQPASGFAC